MPKAINLLLGLTLKRTDHHTTLFRVLNQHINHSRSFMSHTMFCKGLSGPELNPILDIRDMSLANLMLFTIFYVLLLNFWITNYAYLVVQT